jgi:6-phosphofructokinase 1
VERACDSINCAYVEAKSVPNGVGLVKLMGRDAGFVARNAALSSQSVDLCLIPELPFEMYGEGGMLDSLTTHIKNHGHAVVVMAESAGQEYLPSTETDDTGHAKYQDVGVWMKEQIELHLKSAGTPGKCIYIDPSYMIRSCPANPQDQFFCLMLSKCAVHSAFQGYTGICVGMVHSYFVILPLAQVTSTRRQVNLMGTNWQAVMEQSRIKIKTKPKAIAAASSHTCSQHPLLPPPLAPQSTEPSLQDDQPPSP